MPGTTWLLACSEALQYVSSVSTVPSMLLEGTSPVPARQLPAESQVVHCALRGACHHDVPWHTAPNAVCFPAQPPAALSRPTFPSPALCKSPGFGLIQASAAGCPNREVGVELWHAAMEQPPMAPADQMRVCQPGTQACPATAQHSLTE